MKGTDLSGTEGGLFDRTLVDKYDRPGPRYTSYPTAPHFGAFTPADYRSAVARSEGAGVTGPLSVYIHLPFCESLCYYCGCNKVITRNTTKADRYLGFLKQEIALQGKLFDPHRRLTQLHLGGGTPTFYDDEALAELMEAVLAAFSPAPEEEREFSIEVDPRTVTPERIHALHAMGFNRLSLGIQDFDPAVQKAVNREQSEESVKALMDAAREAGFASISVDLIYGLPLQTLESFSTTLDKIIAMAPDRIATYSYAHLPEHFAAQRLIDPEEMPPPERKLELLELIVQRLCSAGYVYIGMDHFARPEDELARARESGTLHRNFQGYSTHSGCDLVGLGLSAIGRVGDSYSQNPRTLPEYYGALERGELPVNKGYRLDFDDRLRGRVIQDLMCQGRVDMQGISREYDIEFSEYFASALAALEEPLADGLCEIRDHQLQLLPPGRLLMRPVAMAFDASLHGPGPEGIRYSRSI